jgi:uncharacterized protein involved in cysteine biosynthesis
VGPPPVGPAGYAQPVAGPGAPRTDSKAIVGLVLSIASFMLCPVILAIVALVLAGQSDRAIASSGGWLEGRTLNRATRWISWINIVLSIVVVVGLIVVMVVAFSTGTTWDDPAQF